MWKRRSSVKTLGINPSAHWGANVTVKKKGKNIILKDGGIKFSNRIENKPKWMDLSGKFLNKDVKSGQFLNSMILNRSPQKIISSCVYPLSRCRYGAPSGHRRAHTRAWSPIRTVRQDSESSAPSPIHTSSRSTLAAKPMLPWTLNTSVSSGDTSPLAAVYHRGVNRRSRGRTAIWIAWYWQSLSGQGAREPLKLLVLLPLWGSLSAQTVPALYGGFHSSMLLLKHCLYSKPLSMTSEIWSGYKCAFRTLETQ